ncbi:MAG: hypothetical protein IJI53_08490 [Clostridia bacterium]|nr:hypothetical protein [Clostridia bacterium]MBR0408061.1 hypothetical protein [Clostridia bacterium]
MSEYLGRSVEAALSSLPEGAEKPRIVETAAPRRDGNTRKDGTLRVVAVRDGEWITARFYEDARSEE